MNVKLLHTSDLHIDWLFGKFSEQARKVRRRELLRVLDVIADVAIAEEVQGVLVAGDLFDSSRVDRHTLTTVWLAFERLTNRGIKVFVIPGNHDEEITRMFAGIGEDNENVYLFAPGRENVVELENLTIYGVPYETAVSGSSPLQRLRKRDNPGYHVAMLHGTVKTLPLVRDNYGPIEATEIADSGMDYIALGHYHNFQDCSAGRVKAFYSGSPSTLSFDNIGERYVLLVEFSAVGTGITPVSIPSRPYKVYQYNATGKTLPDLYRQLERWTDPEACVKVIIKGIVDLDLYPLQVKIREQFAEKFFYLEVVEDTTLVPACHPNDQTIKGIFVRKINERLNSPNLTEEERLLLLETLRVGLTAIEGRRLD